MLWLDADDVQGEAEAKKEKQFGILLKSQITKITVIAREHVLFSLELFFWSLPCYSGWHSKFAFLNE